MLKPIVEQLPKNFFNSARISEEHLAIALAQVKLGFWELDLKTKLIECTSQNRINLGLSASEVITEQTINEAILPEDRWRREEALNNAMRPETPVYDFEMRVRHPDHKIHWLQVRGTVIFEQSKPVRIIGTTIDISDKKGVEILRDELLNITTHELKSPLSVVKGYLQLLQKYIAKIGDSKHQLIAERAITASGKVERLMEDMTNNQLHYQSEMILSKEEINLKELALEVISNANLTNEDFELTLTTITENLSVSADRYRIAQVMTNLINNAIKYSPGESKVEIEISGDHTVIKVSIIDSGIGISEKEHTKVFEKFYRVENTSRIAQGSGIGLFLCSEIIAHHGGEIKIETNPKGKGTVAQFSLPL
ncbi:PAS domain-containing sensor histidine kinase [Pedobacter aquatilis]|uniref:PAS domain-containing sensor histidine kinase n=1 Tax=Pedobacter aquatilis TaxID=351343 RepID=UPI00292F6EE8|nr:PAS domain-containing sensor histidine kinase [Pedobacter aquatilis]